MVKKVKMERMETKAVMEKTALMDQRENLDLRVILENKENPGKMENKADLEKKERKDIPEDLVTAKISPPIVKKMTLKIAMTIMAMNNTLNLE